MSEDFVIFQLGSFLGVVEAPGLSPSVKTVRPVWRLFWTKGVGSGILFSPPMSNGTSLFKPHCIPEWVWSLTWGSEEMSSVLRDRD